MGFGDLLGKLAKTPTLPSVEGRWVKDPLMTFLGSDEYGNEDRADGFHPSQLYYLCPIQVAFKLLYPERALECTDKPDAASQLTFAVGNAVHYWLQNYMLGPAGVLEGYWRCISCGVETKTVQTMPEACQDCGRRMEYREIEVRYAPLNIVGHTDGILRLLPAKTRRAVAEFKTIKPPNFDKLKRPYENHKWQVNTYVGCLRRMGFEDIDRGVIVYINKGDQRGPGDQLAIKEFEIPYDPLIWAEVEAKIGTVRMVHRVFKEEGKKGLLSLIKGLRRVCYSPTFWKAKQCAYSKECFEGCGG